jgi:hypothetical protein
MDQEDLLLLLLQLHLLIMRNHIIVKAVMAVATNSKLKVEEDVGVGNQIIE